MTIHESKPRCPVVSYCLSVVRKYQKVKAEHFKTLGSEVESTDHNSATISWKLSERLEHRLQTSWFTSIFQSRWFTMMCRWYSTAVLRCEQHANPNQFASELQTFFPRTFFTVCQGTDRQELMQICSPDSTEFEECQLKGRVLTESYTDDSRWFPIKALFGSCQLWQAFEFAFATSQSWKLQASKICCIWRCHGEVSTLNMSAMWSAPQKLRKWHSCTAPMDWDSGRACFCHGFWQARCKRVKCGVFSNRMLQSLTLFMKAIHAVIVNTFSSI